MVYAAAGAVCGAACFSMGLSDGICIGASVGAGVVDTAMTQNFSSALITIGGGAASLYMAGKDAAGGIMDKMSAGVDKAFGTGGAAGSEGSTSSCISAAANGVQALMKNKAAGEADKTAEAATQSADKIAAAFQQQNNPQFATGTNAAGYSSQGSISGPTTNSAVSGSGDTTAARETTLDPCAGQGFQGTIQCAMASDKNIPSWMGDPGFADKFQKLTGMSGEQFMDKFKNEGPGAAMAAGMGASLNAEGKGQLGQLVADLQNAIGGQSGAYAGGGRGGGRTGDKPDPFQNLFGQNGGANAVQAKSLSFNENKYTGPRRFPANVEMDRNISLFERVTSRYHFVHGREFPTQLYTR